MNEVAETKLQNIELVDQLERIEEEYNKLKEENKLMIEKFVTLENEKSKTKAEKDCINNTEQIRYQNVLLTSRLKQFEEVEYDLLKEIKILKDKFKIKKEENDKRLKKASCDENKLKEKIEQLVDTLQKQEVKVNKQNQTIKTKENEDLQQLVGRLVELGEVFE